MASLDLSTMLSRYHLLKIDPTDIHPDLLAWLEELLKKPYCVDLELLKMRHDLEGDPEAISEERYPKPPRVTPLAWRQNRPLLKHVNLVQPVARTWVNAVYSGEASRNIIKAPYKDAITDWVQSDAWDLLQYDWCIAKAAFGWCAAVPYLNEFTDELDVWLPDPVFMWVKTDPDNVYRLEGIAEVLPDRIQYIHLYGEGIISRAGHVHVNRDFGWLPAVIGYGRDRRRFRQIRGLPLTRDAQTATEAATMIMYNTRLLQKQQAASRLVRIGELEDMKTNSRAGQPAAKAPPSDGASIDLPLGGDAKYITAEPKIDGSLAINKTQLGLLSTASGVPVDVLDATLAESSQSAEGARIRAIPLIHNSKPLTKQWGGDECELVRAGVTTLEHLKTSKPVVYSDIKSRTVIEIRLKPQLIPMSPNEETQDVIAQNAYGLMSDRDAARVKNRDKSEEEIDGVVATMVERRESAGGALALEQQVNGGGRPPKPATGNPVQL